MHTKNKNVKNGGAIEEAAASEWVCGVEVVVVECVFNSHTGEWACGLLCAVEERVCGG
jgi:hypothetical protein